MCMVKKLYTVVVELFYNGSSYHFTLLEWNSVIFAVKIMYTRRPESIEVLLTSKRFQRARKKALTFSFISILFILYVFYICVCHSAIDR